MAAANDDDPGFWPGYVAAVSGLVQGLLIMAMALATAIFALGQLARSSPPAGGVAAARAAGVPPAALRPPPPPSAAAVPQPDPAARLAPAGPLTARAAGLAGTAPAPVAVPGAAAIRTGFQGDAVAIPASAAEPLLAGVDAARASGAQRWRITIGADLHDPRQQRAAYLRLLGLRALLVRHGLPAATIDLWIESGASEQLSREARIEPLGADGGVLAQQGGRP